MRLIGTIREAASENSPFIRPVARRTVGNTGIANACKIGGKLCKKSRISSFERFSSRRVYYAFDFLPGSSDIIYSANTSGQFNLWRQSPPPSHRSSSFSSSSSHAKRSTEELELGAEIQLTGFDEWSVRFIQPLPDGKSTLLFADRDGDENYQIFIANNEVGWQRPLVMKKGVRNNFGIECISPDGRLAAYSSNERSKKDLDVMVTNIKTRETRVILEGDGSYVFGNWSPSAAAV